MRAFGTPGAMLHLYPRDVRDELQEPQGLSARHDDLLDEMLEENYDRGVAVEDGEGLKITTKVEQFMDKGDTEAKMWVNQGPHFTGNSRAKPVEGLDEECRTGSAKEGLKLTMTLIVMTRRRRWN